MNQRKFKVGDKVRRKDGEFFSNEEKVVTVSHVLTPPLLKEGFIVVFEETGTNLHEDALELAKIPFTKSDLKDGMVVTYRDKKARIVFDGKLYTTDVDSDSFLCQTDLEDFSDSLSCIDYEMNDIMKVEYMGEVLWEREEETDEQKRIKELKDSIAKMHEELDSLMGGK